MGDVSEGSLESRLASLQRQLEEAEDTLGAIRAGAVDAFVIDRGRGARVYTLEAADRPYRLLVESMQQGAAVLMPDGTVLFTNPRLAQLLGADPGELRGQSVLRWFSEDDRPEVEMALEIGRTEAVHLQLALRTRDGREVAVDWSSAPMPVDETTAIGIVVTDLTERRKHEAVLRASERLRRIDRRKNEFLATLAHELRNPLAPITNAVELLRHEHAPPATVKRSIGIIDRQVRLLARLVDDLLDLGRITTGRVALTRTHVRIDEVVQRAVETSQPLMQRGGHRLSVQLPVTTLWVEGDENRLSQVFSNLLNNAAVYTTTPSTIELEVAQVDATVRVSVRDPGIGIAPHMLDVVFDMFSQANPGRGGAEGGLGIGLSLVRSLVGSHGGTVRAESEGLGRGACFEVELPLVAAPPPVTASPMEEQGPLLSEMRVLVVDDNEDAAVSLRDVLGLMGVSMVVAHDGESALAQAAVHRPEVILLDLGMPGIDGYETCRRLREVAGNAAIRIVALTGWGMDTDRERTTQAGFDLHLVKPVHPSRILEQLRRWKLETANAPG